MLQTLALRDFIIVDQLDLEFSAGFSVLTGETGAGKSILLDALGLVLGERADSSQIREGKNRAEITAFFSIDPSQINKFNLWLDDQGFPIESNGETLILKRTIESGGRSRAFINGSIATLTQLREAGDWLVDIHGQHAHQLLLKSGAQRQLLDHHAGLTVLTVDVANSFQKLNKSRHRLKQAENAGQDTQRERELLQWQLEELTNLAPQDGEWASIQVDHARLANAAKIISGCQGVVDALSENEHSVESVLSKSNGVIETLAEHDKVLAEIGQSLESTLIQVEEAVHSLNRYLQKLDLDPDRLTLIEERMQALHNVSRKYRTEVDELPKLLTETAIRLDELTTAQDIEQLREQLKNDELAYLKSAKQLTNKRTKAALELSTAVTAVMQDLSMPGGQLKVNLTPLNEYGLNGLEQIEFLIAAHVGSTPRPLAKIASGGELARISLAISVITSEASFTPTLIFDEVDSGIGGAVAETVGNLLAKLGRSHQILCVTHLPQVAAQGDHHLKVSKLQEDGKTVSQVSPLSRVERIEEIARMLGGATITDTTRRHARELLGQN